MRDFLDKVKEVFDREWSGEEKVLTMLCCVLFRSDLWIFNFSN